MEDKRLLGLTARQKQLYQLAQEKKQVTKREAAALLNVSEDTVLRELKILIETGLIIKQGQGKATFYRVRS